VLHLSEKNEEKTKEEKHLPVVRSVANVSKMQGNKKCFEAEEVRVILRSEVSIAPFDGNRSGERGATRLICDSQRESPASGVTAKVAVISWNEGQEAEIFVANMHRREERREEREERERQRESVCVCV